MKKLVPARTEVVKVYCTCRLPDDGHKMVECYQCKEWYHTSCVEIPRTYNRQSELLIIYNNNESKNISSK